MKIINVLTLFLFALLISESSYAGLVGSIKGSYDYGKVNDGTAADADKATNAGYSGEAMLGLSLRLGSNSHLHLSGFYFYDSSKTAKITSTDVALQNFSISPKGYGGDLALRISSLILHGGYGLYTASARNVYNFVGRDLSLTGGKGYHAGLGFIMPVASKWHFVIDGTYRNIVYDKVKIKNSTDAPITLEAADKYNQTLISVGAGIMFTY